jgi:hypothetical protein
MMKAIILFLASVLPLSATVQYLAGFEMGGGFTSGASGYVSSPVYTGGYSFRVNPGNGQSGQLTMSTIRVDGIGNTPDTNYTFAEAYLSFWFQGAAWPSTNHEIARTIRGTISQPTCILKVNSSGNLVLNNNTTDVWTSSQSLTAGVWYRIGFRCDNSATGAYTVRVNGSDWGTGTASFNTSAFTGACIGTVLSATESITWYYDDVVLDDATFHDSVAVLAMSPNGAGYYGTGWTGGTSPTDYTQVDDIPGDGATYAQSVAAGDTITYTMTNISHPVNQTAILAVQLWVSEREVSTGTSVFVLRMRLSSTDVANTGGDAGSTATSYRYYLRTTDPGGGAWSTTDLDGLECGMDEGAASARRMRVFEVIAETLYTVTPATFPAAIINGMLIGEAL